MRAVGEKCNGRGKKKLKGVGNSQDKSSPQTALLRAQKVASSVKAVICRGGGNATQFSRS